MAPSGHRTDRAANCPNKRGASGSIVSLNPTIDPIQRPPAPGIVTLRPATPADLPSLRQWDLDPTVRSAIERCFADPSVHTILLDPLADNTRIHRFYGRLGFECVAKRYFNCHQCCVYRLQRERTPAAN